MSSAEFLAAAPEDVNLAVPVWVSFTEDEGEGRAGQRGFQFRDGRVALVTPFDFRVLAPAYDMNAIAFPMASPSGDHVYMDDVQLRQARAHAAYRLALLAVLFNAGYNSPPPPVPSHPNDKYFKNRLGVGLNLLQLNPL